MGIPFYIHVSWFPVLALVTYSYHEVVEEAGIWPWGISLGMALLGFGSVLLHELAHSRVAQAQGISIRSITLFCFGGQALMEEESPTWIGALLVALAGPVMSFGLALVGWGLWMVLPLGSLPRLLAELFSWVNLLLAGFNLLPGLPLDGGNVVKALVWGWSGSWALGFKVGAYGGQVLGVVLTGIGLYTLREGWHGLWIIALGGFIYWLARRYTTQLAR
jgi:Zn-dependent protease